MRHTESPSPTAQLGEHLDNHGRCAMQERHPNSCDISSQAENHHAMFLFVRCRSNLNKEMRTPTRRIVVNKAGGLCGESRTRKHHERCIAMPLVVMPPGEATACERPCSHKAGLSISNGRATTHHGLSGSGPRAHTYQQESFHKHKKTRLGISCAIRTAKATHTSKTGPVRKCVWISICPAC